MRGAIHADGLPPRQRHLSMLSIALGVTLAVLDGAVANIALPTIARDIHADPAAATWVTNAYQLMIVVTLLPVAALGERIGYRRVYLGGLVLFTLGSLASALSDSLATLIAARAFQGLGGAGIMAVNGALIRWTFPQAMLGRGVGLNAMVVSIAAAVGPSVASGILAVASWPWLFAINVPIGLANLALGSRVLPSSDLSRERLDWPSAALNAAMFGLFFVGIGTVVRHRHVEALPLAAILLAFGAAVLLVRRARGENKPLIPVDLLAIRVFALSCVASVLAFSSYMLVFLGLPFFLEGTLHRDQVQTGLLMTAWPVALAIVAPVAGRLSDRVPPAVLGTLGMALLVLGLLSFAFLPAHVTGAGIVWRMAVCGLGFGLFQTPNNRVLLATPPRSRAGAAGGMLATSRLTGMTLGASLTAIIFSVLPRAAEPAAMLTAAALAGLAAVTSLLRA